MCGILFGIGAQSIVTEMVEWVIKHENTRGPDITISGYNDSYANIYAGYVFHRLAIVGRKNYKNTKFIENGNWLLLCNGEVYPPVEYQQTYNFNCEGQWNSDCEWILAEFIKNGINGVYDLLRNSEFAFVIYNKVTHEIHVGRDAFGIRPLYKAYHAEHGTFYGSEMKYFLPIQCEPDWIIEQVPPSAAEINETNVAMTNLNAQFTKIKFPAKTNVSRIDDFMERYNSLINNCKYNELYFYDYELKFMYDCIINGKTSAAFDMYFLKSNDSEIYYVPAEFIHSNGQPFMEFLYYKYSYTTRSLTSHDDKIIDTLYSSLYSAVFDRISHADTPIGYLLSGGLDSSVICALARRITCEPIATFAIGITDQATDVIAAKVVANFINSNHTTVIMEPSQFISEIPNVIWYLETWDITTVRAGTGMYMIAKWIKENTKYKVLLTGEGSDELFGSYRYFLNAPSANAHKNETYRLLNDLRFFDVRRCDGAISGNGLEARVPFLDNRVVTTVLSNFVDDDYLPKENYLKWHLRVMAQKYNLLPDEISFRNKEAFSDGVSTQEKSWHDILRDHYSNYTPSSNNQHIANKELAFNLDEFDGFFAKNREKLIPYTWLPKWCGDENDPSARKLKLSEGPAKMTDN
jgi:asparagine synthetase B (glutamine-hydrolysing)